MHELRGFVEAVQPYNAPSGLSPEHVVFNRTLAILNDWARKARHRKLNVTVSWVSNLNPLVDIPPLPGVRLVYLTVEGNGFLEGEREIAEFKIDGFRKGMDVKANPNLAIDMAVNETPPPCADSDTLGRRITAMQASQYGCRDVREVLHDPEVARAFSSQLPSHLEQPGVWCAK